MIVLQRKQNFNQQYAWLWFKAISGISDLLTEYLFIHQNDYLSIMLMIKFRDFLFFKEERDKFYPRNFTSLSNAMTSQLMIYVFCCIVKSNQKSGKQKGERQAEKPILPLANIMLFPCDKIKSCERAFCVLKCLFLFPQ